MQLRKESRAARASVVLHDRRDGLVIAERRRGGEIELLNPFKYSGKAQVLRSLLKKTHIGEHRSINKFIHLEGGKRVLRVAERLRVLKHLGPLQRLWRDEEPDENDQHAIIQSSGCCTSQCIWCCVPSLRFVITTNENKASIWILKWPKWGLGHQIAGAHCG